MKEAVVGGVLAGLVGGSILAVAVVVTRPSPQDIAINDRTPVRVSVVDMPSVPLTGAPDGSKERPFYTQSDGFGLSTACGFDGTCPAGSSTNPLYVQLGTCSAPRTCAGDGSSEDPLYVKMVGAQGSSVSTVSIQGPVYVWSCDQAASFLPASCR